MNFRKLPTVYTTNIKNRFAPLKILITLILLIYSGFANSEVREYFGFNKSEWPETEYRKVKNNFGGWLLVTSDINWKSKWETPSDTVPIFNESKKVHVGEKIVILTFFVNPKIKNGNMTHVLCSIKVTRPDNTVAVNYKGVTCLEGVLQGNQNNIMLSPVIINFSGEESDPLGEWVVEVTINDVIGKTILNLRNSFILVAKNG